MVNPYREAVVNCDLDKQVNHAKWEAFRTGSATPFQQLIEVYGYPAFKCAVSMLINKRKKKARVKSKVQNIVEAGECLFLTLTFTDEVLNSTSEETRRRYVSRFLKSQCNTYVANIDYGSRKEREHYHALVYAPSVDYSKWHKYGAIKGERVRTGENDLERVVKYVLKLSRHAIKETAGKGRRTLYSRNCVDNLVPAWLLED